MTITLGEFLQKSREEKGLTLTEAAYQTKIREHYLNALENNQIDSLPSKVQGKGYLRIYAQFLGLEEGIVIDAWNHPTNLVLEKEQEFADALDTHIDSPEEEILIAEEIPEEISSSNEQKIYHGDPLDVKDEELPIEEETTVSKKIFISIGKQLQEQRLLLNLSKEDIEQFTNIRTHYLNALESGAIERLPSIPQARGMLNNYATFLNLNLDKIMGEFAEGLQTKRNESYAPQKVGLDNQLAYQSPEIKKVGWLKFITADLLLTSGLIIGLFIFILWGAANISGFQNQEEDFEPPSISEILLENTPEIPEDFSATEIIVGLTQTINQELNPVVPPESGEDEETEIGPQLSGLPVQVYIIARQRAYLKVEVDGETVFTGRTIPGNAYEYSGSISVEILTGNAAALEIYYNLNPIGVIGEIGEVKSILFTSSTGLVTPTPRFSPSPTSTNQPSPTLQPTATATPIPPTPSPTVTPLIP
jgi:cytoskeletal protein RodZ